MDLGVQLQRWLGTSRVTGYRPLLVLLPRGPTKVNHNRIWRVYQEAI